MIITKARVTGLEEVRKWFGFVTRGGATSGMRRGVTAGCMILRDRMRVEAPVGAGVFVPNQPRRKLKLLRKSLGYKVKVYRGSGAVVGIVGPRRGFRTVIDGKAFDPVRYAHIVENGHGPIVVKTKKVLSDGHTIFGTRVAATPPNPFMQRAFTATESQIMARITQVAVQFFIAGALK